MIDLFKKDSNHRKIKKQFEGNLFFTEIKLAKWKNDFNFHLGPR